MKVARQSQAQLSFPGLAPSPTDRLFFALRPDMEATRRALEITERLCAQHGLKGKRLAPDRLHVSLCGLGDFAGLPDGLIEQARAAAGTVAMPAFEVGFDRAATFRRTSRRLPPVVLLSDLPLIPLLEFQSALGAAMVRHGLTGRVPTSFTPHMTLLYDATHVAPQPIPPVEWIAREFVLIHSRLGTSTHIPLGRWPLAPS